MISATCELSWGGKGISVGDKTHLKYSSFRTVSLSVVYLKWDSPWSEVPVLLERLAVIVAGTFTMLFM